jgi:single-stranded-DNA-specific exonuclease
MIDGEEINRLVSFFTEDDPDELLNYITWINETNERRKNDSKEAVDNLGEIDSSLGAVVYVTSAKEGILGLIANHICTKYHLPTIVLTHTHDKTALKGSCRAPEGFNIVEAFKELSHLMLAGGGHAQAGGCTISVQHFEEFKDGFIKICKEKPIVYIEKPTVEIKINEVIMDNYNLIKTFSPFGESWKAPLLELKGINTRSLYYSKTGEHIFTPIGNQARIVGFNYSKRMMMDKYFVNFTGSLRLNSFRGATTLDFLIKEIVKDNL